ncbi:MAG: hypothetical protein ACD_46C00235G0003 [uncultured bacterium]|nr:MAG: hypothetical protein ACD_46C00235G0003 [uncultured bacterium]
MAKVPTLIEFKNQKQFRIIPSSYPPINFFEDLVDASEMEILFEIESMTNERLLEEAGDIFLVPNEDRIAGPGSTVVMAAFTHIGRPSRFTDGSFGVYYASLTLETAIRETVFHREKFLSSTQEPACEISMRTYEGKILQPLYDVRKKEYHHLHHPDDYSASQSFGRMMREKNSWGMIYNSVRHSGGECIAALRTKTISVPIQTKHLRYVWNGKKIANVLDVRSML